MPKLLCSAWSKHKEKDGITIIILPETNQKFIDFTLEEAEEAVKHLQISIENLKAIREMQ